MTAVKETIPVDTRFRGGMSAATEVDVRGLRRRLQETVEGEVRFDAGTKALYATDASNYRQVPLGVVIPKTLDDVVATHRACHEFGAPTLPRGGGTSLSGETVNFAVVIAAAAAPWPVADPAHHGHRDDAGAAGRRPEI